MKAKPLAGQVVDQVDGLLDQFTDHQVGWKVFRQVRDQVYWQVGNKVWDQLNEKRQKDEN